MQGMFLCNPFATDTFEQLSLTVKAEKFVQTSDTLQVGWMCMCVVVQGIESLSKVQHSEGVNITHVLLVVFFHPQPHWIKTFLHCLVHFTA